MNVKKILALVMALVMVLAMSATAFAAAVTADFTTATGNDAPAVVDTTNGFNKVKFYVNFDPATGLTTPAYTFEYAITAGAARNDELGNDGDGPDVKAGVGTLAITPVGTGATAGQVVFQPGDTQKEVEIDLSGLSFAAGAGIYRYKITQQAITADGIKAGVLNDKGNGNIEVRFLDLYVDKDGKIVGAVMFKDTTIGSTAADGGSLAAVNNDGKVPYSTNKVNSFDNTFGKEGNTDPDPDDHTYPPANPDPDPTNSGLHTVTIEKTIDGNMASASQEFPFEITIQSLGLSLKDVKCSISSTAGTSNLEFTGGNVTKDSTNYFLVLSANATGENTYTVGLKGGDKVEFKVPNNVTVKVQEKTEAGEGYVVTDNVTSGGSDYTLEAGSVKQTIKENDTGTKKYLDETGLKVKVDTKDQAPAFSYLNERSAISPTGVVLRYAPYFVMLAAGVALFIIFAVKRRKNEEEEA